MKKSPCQEHQDHQKDGTKAGQDALQILLLPGGCGRFLYEQLLLHDDLRLLIGDASAPDKQTMGIDSEGRTGHQRAVILSFCDSQIGGIVGQHGVDGIHLIGQGLAQDLQIEHISMLQLVEIRKELLGRHTGMGGEDAVGTLSANRQGCAQQMSNTHIQRFGLRSVIDGQIHPDHGDLNVAHDPIPCHVEQAVIVLSGLTDRLLGKGVAALGTGNQCGIIGGSSCSGLQQLGIIDLIYDLLILGMDLGLVPLVIPIADQRVQGDAQGQQEHQDRGTEDQ